MRKSVTMLISSIVVMLCLSPMAHSTELVGGAIAGYFAGSSLIREAGEEYRRNLRETRRVAETVVSKGDNALKDRIAQVDRVAARTIEKLERLLKVTEKAVLKIIKDANKKLLGLQKVFFQNIRQTLEFAVCKVDITLNQHLKQVLGDVGQLLGTNSMEIIMPIKSDPNLPSRSWYAFWSKTDKIVYPLQVPFDQTYVAVRDRLIENLSYIKQSDSAHKIRSTYDFIAKLAERTACHTVATEEAYIREMKKYQSMSRQWERVLNVEVKF